MFDSTTETASFRLFLVLFKKEVLFPAPFCTVAACHTCTSIEFLKESELVD